MPVLLLESVRTLLVQPKHSANEENRRMHLINSRRHCQPGLRLCTHHRMSPHRNQWETNYCSGFTGRNAEVECSLTKATIHEVSEQGSGNSPSDPSSQRSWSVWSVITHGPWPWRAADGAPEWANWVKFCLYHRPAGPEAKSSFRGFSTGTPPPPLGSPCPVPPGRSETSSSVLSPRSSQPRGHVAQQKQQGSLHTEPGSAVMFNNHHRKALRWHSTPATRPGRPLWYLYFSSSQAQKSKTD